MAKKANKPKGQLTIDQSMQDNGVNRVFFQNEGCIFNAEKPRVTPGSAYYLPVNELS